MAFRWNNGVLEYWSSGSQKWQEIIVFVPQNPSLQYSIAPILPGPDLANRLCAQILMGAPGQAKWGKAPKFPYTNSVPTVAERILLAKNVITSGYYG